MTQPTAEDRQERAVRVFLVLVALCVVGFGWAAYKIAAVLFGG